MGDTVPTDAFDPAAEWVGFAQDTFDGLGSHTADCGGTPPVVLVINEFSASTVGTDVEYVELLGTVGADLSAYRVLEIEGDGELEHRHRRRGDLVRDADADGRALASLAADSLENGTMSLLLVRDFAGAVGDDVDADDDGVLDAGFAGRARRRRGRARRRARRHPLRRGGPRRRRRRFGDFAPGGASRIPDGTDTDSHRRLGARTTSTSPGSRASPARRSSARR